MKKLIFLFFIISTSSYANLLYKIDDGIKLYNSSDFKASIGYFENYIKGNPNDEDGYFWLAQSYDKMNNAKNALINYKKAYSIALKDKNIDKIDFENNEFDNLEDYFDMAVSYYEEENYKEALNYANMMLKIDSDCSSAYFIKAKVAYAQGNNILALSYMNKAILLNNELLNTRLAKALKIEKVPELSKEDIVLYAQKAYFKGDLNSSIEYLKSYLELDNMNVDIYTTLINCYLKNNNIAEAKNILAQAKKLFQKNVSLMLSEADIAYSEKDNKYKNILLNIYKINPSNKNVLLKLGNYYLDCDNYEEAKKYFETLIKVDDSLYEGYFGYIYSLIKTNEINKAQNLIRTLFSLNQNSGEAYYLLSLICSYNKEYKDALNYALGAIKKEKNPFYYAQAGKLYYLLGDYNRSINCLRLVSSNKIAQEYLILNYLKTNGDKKGKDLTNLRASLDKDRILYKYYLYKTYKIQDNKELDKILKQKPDKLEDYTDIARIYVFEDDKQSAQKILDKASKKFSQSYEINSLRQELLL